MPTLKNKHKAFIVKQLACYERTGEIITELKERFGVETNHAQVAYYNPETEFGGRNLAQKWRHLFDKTRDGFIEGTIDIPIAHKRFRMKELQKNYEKLILKGKIMEANQVLEQAAKEMGDAYTSAGALAAAAGDGATVNFYQQVNQRIVKMNQK